MPGSTGTPGGASFSQLLNDQPDLPPPPAQTDPIPAQSDAAQASTEDAPRTPAPGTAVRRKDPPATPVAKARDPRAMAESAADGRRDTAETAGLDGTPIASASDQGKATEAAEVDTEASGLNEFTQLIGLPSPASANPAALPAVPEATAASTPATNTAEASAPGNRPASAEPAAQAAARAAASANPMTGTDVALAAKDAARSTLERRVPDATSRTSEAGAPAATATSTEPPRHRSQETPASRQAIAAAAASEIQRNATSDAPTRPAATAEAPPVSFAALMAQAQAQPAAAQAEALATPVTTTVHAALHSTVFAPELSARVSLLAVNGVQQAELQLNPAEMGPVAVQITVDGALAQVSFHAAQADTRQALEQSLPDLAAALQGQGLTLSGGGVFQQPPRDAPRGTDEAEGDNRRDNRSTRAAGTGPVSAGSATAASAARRTVGLLDTFA